MAAATRRRILFIQRVHERGHALATGRGDVGIDVYEGRDPDEIRRRIADADAVVVRTAVIDRSVIDAAPRLAIISRHGVGYDAVDIAAAAERSIPVTITPLANSVSVAEHAMFMLLALAKNARENDAAGPREPVRAGAGLDEAARPRRARPAHRRLRPHRKPGGAAGDGVRHERPRLRPLRRADGDGSGGLRLGRRPARGAAGDGRGHRAHAAQSRDPGDHRVEGARADEADRVRGQHRARRGSGRGRAPRRPGGGSDRGAGLDVFESEPTPPGIDHPLLGFDNVIVSPHCAGVTVESSMRMAEYSVRNVLDCFDGRLDPEVVVNRHLMPEPLQTVASS